MAQGATVAQVPNDLTVLPGVKQPDSPDDLVFGADGGGGTLVAQAIAGVGDVATRALFLGGIVVIVILGARMVLSNDGTPDLGKLVEAVKRGAT